MRFRSALFGLCAVAVTPLTSLAAADQPQPMTAAANGSYELDQDTPDNSVSVWQVAPLSNVNAVRAKLTVRRLGSRGANPTFGLALSNDTDTVQFQAFTKPGKTTLVPLVSEEADHTEKGCLVGGVYASTFEVGETVDVGVDWTATGNVTITLRDKAAQAFNGFERCSVKMRGGPPTSLKVIAMTGEAEWKPLQLGTVASSQ